MHFCGLLILVFSSVTYSQVIPVNNDINQSLGPNKGDLYQSLQDTLEQITGHKEILGYLYMRNHEKNAMAPEIPIALQIFGPKAEKLSVAASNLIAEPGCEGNVVILKSADKDTTLGFQAGLCIAMNRNLPKPKVHIGEFSVSGASNMEFSEILERFAGMDLESFEENQLEICFQEVGTREQNCLRMSDINRLVLPFVVLSKRDLTDDIDEVEDQENGWLRLTEILSELVGDSLNQKLTDKLSSLSRHDLKKVYDWRKDVNEEFNDSLEYSFQRIDKDHLVKRNDQNLKETGQNLLMQDLKKDDQTSVGMTDGRTMDCSPVTWFNIFRHSVFGTNLCQ